MFTKDRQETCNFILILKDEESSDEELNEIIKESTATAACKKISPPRAANPGGFTDRTNAILNSDCASSSLSPTSPPLASQLSNNNKKKTAEEAIKADLSQINEYLNANTPGAISRPRVVSSSATRVVELENILTSPLKTPKRTTADDPLEVRLLSNKK